MSIHITTHKVSIDITTHKPRHIHTKILLDTLFFHHIYFSIQFTILSTIIIQQQQQQHFHIVFNNTKKKRTKTKKKKNSRDRRTFFSSRENFKRDFISPEKNPSSTNFILHTLKRLSLTFFIILHYFFYISLDYTFRIRWVTAFPIS